MKLRQLHSDFKVEELSDIKISRTKEDYKVYSVEKSGIETFFLLDYLSRQNRIPSSEIGIAGMKDRHAVTKQYLTIPSRFDLKTVKEENFSIRFLGFVSQGLKLGDLRGNRFEITVRDIKKGEIDGTYEKARTVSQFGVPNYFDSQRFGSALSGEFIAKHLIRKDYERAVKIFLTTFTKSEKKRLKEDKRQILENWGSLHKARPQDRILNSIVDEYLRKKDWLAAYRRIPGNLREIFISAYQSWLWNECVKELLKRKVDRRALYPVEYNLGSLLFYKRITAKELEQMPKTFRTISDELSAEGLEKDIIDKVLAKEGVRIDDFRIKDAVGNFFKSRERQVLLKPNNFHLSQPMIDELNDRGRENRFKMIVKFELPKASYATIIIKRLFNQ